MVALADSSIGDLSSSLSPDNNKLTGSIPTEIGLLSKLKYLELCTCPIDFVAFILYLDSLR